MPSPLKLMRSRRAAPAAELLRESHHSGTVVSGTCGQSRGGLNAPHTPIF